MKYKHIILFAALALITTASSAQIQFTAGINYESGVPSGAPSSTGSRLRVDLASGRIYQWSAANTTWRTLGQGIDIVAGCAAPAYTPGYAQSVFAVNGCSTPELYYYNGTQWKQVAGGGGGGGTTYYAGTGIDIDANDTISIDTVPRLIFYSDQTYSGGVGAMRWNSDDGTLDLGLKGGNVTLQLGQELVQPVKHATNGGLDNGKVVYITGSSGDNKTVLYARANDEATSANTLGLMTETVTGGNKGFCTTFGLVRNINTSNLTEGGAVWLSKDTAGAMTAVRPEAPNNGVFIGFCVRKHASTGVIFVNVQNGYELEELHNVYAPSPTNGQVLTYVSGNSRWEAATVADQSATNELQTLSVASNTATLSNSGGSVTIAGGGINTVGTAGSTITVTGTEVDGSVTNELQTIDTFSLSGQTLRASLSSDGQAAKTVTLPVVGITAGTNVTVSSTGGNFTINASGGGGGTPAGNTGEIQFNNGGAFGASSNLFWDNTNVRLGVSTSVPAANIDINTPLSNTSNLLDVTHNSVLRTRLERTGRQTWYVGTLPSTIIGSVAYETPGGSPGIIIRTGSTGLNRLNLINHGTFFNLEYDAIPYGLIYFSSRNVLISGSTNAPTDANYRLDIQSTGASAGGLRVTSSGIGSGTNAILVRNSNGNEILKLQDNTKVNFFSTNTATGTTAVQTINKPSGTINIAAGESSKLVNNSLCTTSSIVLPVMRTNDATALIDSVVPGNGSFTINLTAAAAAEISVGFFIIN